MSTTMNSMTMRTDPSGLKIRWPEALAARYRDEGAWEETTLVDAARRAVAEDSSRILLIEGDRRLTRGEAWDQALRLASFLVERGLKAGDVVSFQLPNWVEAAVLALSARMLGLIVNPIPPIYRESELGYILADCKARMIFIPETFHKHDHRATIESLRGDLPALDEVIVVRGEHGFFWAQALQAPPMDPASLPKIDPSSVMMVMYTSGTTGKPKDHPGIAEAALAVLRG